MLLFIFIKEKANLNIKIIFKFLNKIYNNKIEKYFIKKKIKYF